MDASLSEGPCWPIYFARTCIHPNLSVGEPCVSCPALWRGSVRGECLARPSFVPRTGTDELPCPQVLVPLCPQPTAHHSARAPTLDLRGARFRTATSTHHRLILLDVHRRHEQSRRVQTPSTTRSLLPSSPPQVVSSRDSRLGRRSRPCPSTRCLFSDLPRFDLFLWTRLRSDLLPAAPEDRPSASTNLDPRSGRRLRLDGSVDRVVPDRPLSFSLLITLPLSLPCFSCFLVVVAHLHSLICIILLSIFCPVQCTRSTISSKTQFKREEDHSERKQSNKRRRELDASLHDF